MRVSFESIQQFELDVDAGADVNLAYNQGLYFTALLCTWLYENEDIVENAKKNDQLLFLVRFFVSSIKISSVLIV